MCGITGFADLAGHDVEASHSALKRMSDAIVHRGPDEGGAYVDPWVALGHRRLSIIDLSSGQQPMAALGGQLQIVFNGEVYNFRELRTQLQARGHRFLTHSDTEVILLAYAEWGVESIARLHGMFAFAIWDLRSKTLVLARDRVGKKPLYYHHRNGHFAFASELKSLRTDPRCPGEPDPQALDCYFSLGYIPTPATIFRDVYKLPAAHYMVVNSAGHTLHRYWNLSFAGTRQISMGEAVEEFEALLEDAVRCRLMSEVPLGAFLSGGIDSALVVSSMARQSSSPVITNSIGFADKQYNELEVARAVAAHLGTEHHEFTVEPQATQVIDRIAWHFDEPLADSSAVPTWYVCEMTRRTVTVALSGDGGDESFGGYSFRYAPHMMESKLRHVLPTPLRRMIFGPLGSLWPASVRLPKPLRLKTIFENLAVSDAEAFYSDLAWLRTDTRAAVYRPEFVEQLRGFTPMETVHGLYAHNDASDALGRAQYTDINFYMTDDVLAKVDRMSMAHALEVRSPLLDHRIIEFAARLPATLKLNTQQGKLVLRNLVGKRLPASIQNMPKRGFSIPAARWLREELRPLAEGLIFERGGLIEDLLEPRVVRRLWREHLDGHRDHNVFLWGLMMLGLWQHKHAMVQ